MTQTPKMGRSEFIQLVAAALPHRDEETAIAIARKVQATADYIFGTHEMLAKADDAESDAKTQKIVALLNQ